MKTVFVGTSDFAVPSLEALIASAHDILAVVSQPDRPRGRGKAMQMTPVKEIALAHSIPVLQPAKIRDPEAIAQIKSFGPIGALVVAAYGQKIPTELLKWPEFGPVNVHGSILPKYRGAAPIQHAIMMGETQTGVTTMFMAEGLDTGDILLQDVVDIYPDETAGELSERLAIVGSRLLIRTLTALEEGEISPVPQDDELATIARSLPRDAGEIDWTFQSQVIVNKVRGCTPKPGSFTAVNGTQLKVWQSAVVQTEGKIGEPGEVLNIGDGGIEIAAGEGSVRLVEIQPESRKRMQAEDFARGHKLSVGDRLIVQYHLPV